MEKAKQAVSGFLSKDGKHDTTVHENVNPAVTNEHVTRTHHENATKAIDREVHQDHYHTSIQPIAQKEVLPEQHTHNVGNVEHREINHGDDKHIRDRLATEAAQFKNTREVGQTQQSQSVGKDVVGEHVHHHVHESIQPVIQKETVQPSVVHTTIPVHEVHHNEAKHHAASALPAMSMDDFKRQGGSLSGRDERRDEFNGEPRGISGALGGGGVGGGHQNSMGNNSSSTAHHTGGHGSQNPRDSGVGMADGKNRSGVTGGNNAAGVGHGKPSLMDKLNPKVDANGDGKAGFMK